MYSLEIKGLLSIFLSIDKKKMSRTQAQAVQEGQDTYTSDDVKNLQAAARQTALRGDKLSLNFDNSGGQSIVVDPNLEVLDQFIYRPSATFLIEDAPPNVQRALLSGLPVSELQGVDLPLEFDARKKWPDAITIPMEQGTCGSCWAFSTATAISDRIRIADPNNKELRTLINYQPYGTRNITYRILNNLSPYEMVYCDTCGPGNSQGCDMGCAGGFLRIAYDYVKRVGISTLLCNPPGCDPTKQKCPCTKGKDCKIYKATESYLVFRPGDSNEVKKRKIQEDVFQFGPVTIGYKIYPSFKSFFQTNPNGVYTQQEVTQAEVAANKFEGHAVDIIGWGSQPVFHWLIRNSWSPIWAEDGHFKIQYDIVGILNECYASKI